MNALRILLLPFSLIYGTVVIIRNWLFDAGVLTTTRVSVPVISVGNISTGGVGKTPLVELIARQLRDRGKKVAIISRGYKRNTRGYVVVSNGKQRCAEVAESGDEPSQLANKLDNVVIAVDENRVRAAQNVISEFHAEVIILDDGFQHRYLHRDLNICIVPADELSSFHWLLPAGNRREPSSSLRRADLTVVSRCADERSFNLARSRFAKWTNNPVVGMKTRSSGLRKVGTGNDLKLSEVAGRKAVAFSGIGNPPSFEQALRSLSIEVLEHHRYPDHHRFSLTDIESIISSFKRHKADFIVTTEKDIARLKGQPELVPKFFEMNPVYYLDIEADVVWRGDTFRSMIAQFA